MRPINRIIRLGVLAAIALLQGCAKKTDATGPAFPAGIVIVQGNGQAAQAGKELPTPVVLRVVDATGAGMVGKAITLALGDGGGAVDPASAVSDAKGEIRAKWTLGPSVPAQSLFASTPGVSAVKLNAVAILPSEVIIAQGNNQSAKAGTALVNSIVIRVVGSGNMPLIGVTVALQITSGGGAISPQTATTTALGEVVAKWTLGTAPGINMATITVSTLNTVTLTANGTP
jgi:hypothetical protein